jgi:phage-related holin
MLLVTFAVILEPYDNGVPISLITATGFILMELVSILENAAAIGVWIPPILLDMLEKRHDQKAGRLKQKAGFSGTSATLDRNTRAVEARTAQAEQPRL